MARRSLLQVFAGLMASPRTPVALAPPAAVTTAAVTAVAEPLAVAQRTLRGSQIIEMYHAVEGWERVAHDYVLPYNGLFFAYEDHPEHFVESREEIERTRRALMNAVDEEQLDYGLDTDDRKNLDSSKAYAATAFIRQARIRQEWSADRVARVIDLEESLARQFGRTVPDVQAAIAWIIDPYRLIDYAFDAGPTVGENRLLLSDEFRRAYLRGFARIAPLLAFNIMKNYGETRSFDSVVLHKLMLGVDFFTHTYFVCHRPPYRSSDDLTTVSRAFIAEVVRLERALARLAELPETILVSRATKVMNETLATLKLILKTLPQRLEANRLKIGRYGLMEPHDWETYETVYADKRAEAGITAPLISAAEWLRMINVAAIAHGRLSAMFEEPAVEESAVTEAIEPPEVPTAPCQAALLEHALPVDPIDLRETVEEPHSR